MDQKSLWDELAKENSLYYINSDKGRKITEQEFRQSGERDYVEHIIDDEVILNKFPNLTDLVILDLGCGIGRMTEFMARDFKLVLGTDISGEMIEQGQRRLERLNNVQLLETNGYIIPLPDNIVDFVFSYLVFQHMKEIEQIEENFREVYRILRPEGLFKVRVRTDKLQSMSPWWAGVDCDEKVALSVGFKLLKKEEVGNYGLWLWLEK